MPARNDPQLKRLLTELYARSDAQLAEINGFRARRTETAPLSTMTAAAEFEAFRRDKLVALDRDKAEFCYLLCRANNARLIVEVGTSYGVSTLYLAAAARDNVRSSGGNGLVIGTEYEPEKVSAARALRAGGVERIRRFARGRSA